jgi:hypothetical protein
MQSLVRRSAAPYSDGAVSAAGMLAALHLVMTTPSHASEAASQGPRVSFEVSLQDARHLHAQLRLRLAELDDELVHTDSRQLQHELGRDSERLRAIIDELNRIAAAQGYDLGG